MYNQLYDDLKDCRFVSNNARKDKYVFSINNFHDRFKIKYPIKLCIFPEIVSDKQPSISLCTIEEKERAIVQLIHSTTMQTQDMAEPKTVQKLFEMVKDFEFYKFNLCSDIEENTKFLREFLSNYKPKKDVCEFPELIKDETFDILNVINTETFAVYAMNKFSTSVYKNFKSGVTVENLLSELAKIKGGYPYIESWLKNLSINFVKEGILENYSPNPAVPAQISEKVVVNDDYYPWLGKFYNGERIELNDKGE